MLYHKDKSFTLIELLVVIAIIGLLSSLVMIGIKNVGAKARDSERISDINHYLELLKACEIDKGKLPDCVENGFCDWGSIEYPGLGYDLVSTCSCSGQQFHNLLFSKCPSFTSTTLPQDPVNDGIYAYNYFYFHPDYVGVKEECRGKYVLMTNLETGVSPSSLDCYNGAWLYFANEDYPSKTYWIIVGP